MKIEDVMPYDLFYVRQEGKVRPIEITDICVLESKVKGIFLDVENLKDILYDIKQIDTGWMNVSELEPIALNGNMLLGNGFKRSPMVYVGELYNVYTYNGMEIRENEEGLLSTYMYNLYLPIYYVNTLQHYMRFCGSSFEANTFRISVPFKDDKSVTKTTFEREVVKNIVAKELGLIQSEIQDEDSLMEDLGADSLEVVDIIMSVEKSFNISITDEEVNKMITFGDLVWLVKQKI